MLKRHLLIAMVLFHVALTCAVGAAQEATEEDMPAATPEATPDGADKPGTQTGTPTVPRPIKIDVLQLTDDDGQLVLQKVPLSDYYDALNRAGGVSDKSGIPEKPIRSLIATGKVTVNPQDPSDKGRVDLSVTLKIAVDVEREDWIRIPLGFGQAALKTEPNEADLDRYRIEFEPSKSDAGIIGKRGTYVLWLYGREKRTTEEITLDFCLPLSGIGRENRLVLSVPTSVATTELTLTVPTPNVVGSGANGVDVEEKPNGVAATDLIVRGFRGDIDLTWRSPDEDAAPVAPLLTADGTIKATMAGRRVEFVATLRVTVVRAPAGGLSEFDVRLPRGAVLLEDSDSKYTVTNVNEAEPAADGGRLVRVVLRKPVHSQETVKVDLSAASNAAAATNGLFSLAGFEVSSAIWQTGHIDVCSRGDWEVRCHPGLGVTRKSDVSPDANVDHVVESFDYYEQPFSLDAHAFLKQERISVEPLYYLSIESGRASLWLPLKYAVRGKAAFQLKVELNDWEFDRIEPEHLVMASEVDESGVLLISLQDEPTADEFSLYLSAHRPIDPAQDSEEKTATSEEKAETAKSEEGEEEDTSDEVDAKGEVPLMLRLPKPHATSVSSMALIVLPADNIDLRENPEKTVGLERQKGPSPASLAPASLAPDSLDLPEIQQEPMWYQGETGETDETVFAASMSVRQREITARVSTEVGIAPAKASVNERLIYDVKYEPVRELMIRAPRDVNVEYSLDGEVVAAMPAEESSVDSDLAARRIVLSAPRKGRFELTAVYSVPIGELAPLASMRCVIPLIVPVDVVFAGHRLEAKAKAESGIGIWRGRDSSWLVRNGETAYGSSTVTEFVAETPEDRLDMYLFRKDPDTLGSAVVHRAWVQTWMIDSQRCDRAIYRFVSDRSHFAITLPVGADTDLLRLRLDGKRLVRQTAQKDAYDVSGRKVSVFLTPEQTPRPHVLELQYPCNSRPGRGNMLVELPSLREDVWVRRFYWQLVLPASEHVVLAPKDYAAEYDWEWTGAWWGRVPTKEQLDLEAWVGAASEEPLDAVPEATSRYLFSKFGPPNSVTLTTASRTWIVGGASGLALLVGLLLIYVPGLRHPFFGLVLIVVVAGSAVAWPGASLLLAQAAGMGVVLSLLGAILYRGVARRRRRTVRRDVPSSVFERGSTQAQFGSSEVEVLRSTATEPDAAAVHAPER